MCLTSPRRRLVKARFPQIKMGWLDRGIPGFVRAPVIRRGTKVTRNLPMTGYHWPPVAETCGPMRTFFRSVFLLIAIAQAAAASDLPVKAPPAPASYDWTGFYLGGHMGYAWGNLSWSTTGASGAFSLAEPIDIFSETGSFYEGLQTGYDYMLPDRYVIGVEGDVSFPSFPNLSGISIGGSSTFSTPAIGTETYSETALTFGTRGGRSVRSWPIATFRGEAKIRSLSEFSGHGSAGKTGWIGRK